MKDRSYENLLWIAWPCLSIGGQANHVHNVRACRCVPALSTTFMSFYSGCFGAAVATILLIDIIHDNAGVDYYIQFRVRNGNGLGLKFCKKRDYANPEYFNPVRIISGLNPDPVRCFIRLFWNYHHFESDIMDAEIYACQIHSDQSL